VATGEPRWHAEAALEAEETRDWYAQRSPFAARGFLLELTDALQAVVEAPDRWPRGRHNTRRYVFPRKYPFTLVYRLAADGLVEVVAVAHQKRHPEYWAHR
jgi:toxin ParE1/3/4